MFVYGLYLEYLWCYIVWCPAEGGGGHPVLDSFFAHPEVRDLDVALNKKLENELKYLLEEPLHPA